jgi:hypothetical protein
VSHVVASTVSHVASSVVVVSSVVSVLEFTDLYIINITQPLTSWILGLSFDNIPASFKALI